MFRRKIYDRILEWKRRSNGRYALMIEGARRIGKSTIIEEFVKNEYGSYILIRFDRPNTRILKLFEMMDDLDRFFLLLQQRTGVRLEERNSAIVFDEVQLFPVARQAIKALVEDGRYDYYETGSLISIKKNVSKILIPSEEHTMEMYPMDFEEFLWARGDEITMPIIRESFDKRVPLEPDLHDSIMDLYREYMLVGGMPQAVSALLEKNSFAAAEDAKAEIVSLYLKDAAKIDGDGSGRKATSIMRSLSANLERHEKRFSPSVVRKDSRVRDYIRSVNELEDSKMVNVCYRNTDPSADLMAHYDEDSFKIYYNDTGLLFTASFEGNDSDEIYERILDGDLNINKGMYFENMVSQELKCSGHMLFFSKFSHPDSDREQEIDFIITRDGKPCPVESKSGRRSREHKSLDRFMDKYSDRLGECFVVHRGNLSLENGITYIPIYMASLL